MIHSLSLIAIWTIIGLACGWINEYKKRLKLDNELDEFYHDKCDNIQQHANEQVIDNILVTAENNSKKGTKHGYQNKKSSGNI